MSWYGGVDEFGLSNLHRVPVVQFGSVCGLAVVFDLRERFVFGQHVKAVLPGNVRDFTAGEHTRHLHHGCRTKGQPVVLRAPEAGIVGSMCDARLLHDDLLHAIHVGGMLVGHHHGFAARCAGLGTVGR